MKIDVSLEFLFLKRQRVLSMRDLKCDPKSLAGPIDKRVVAKLKGLDPDFVAHMTSCHGGRPQIGAFQVANKRGKIGQFLTLLDDRSKLQPPARPHFEHDDDERVINSIWYLGGCEHATCRALFQDLVPFAALLADMCLDRAYVDLLCFDNRNNAERPPIVLWIADKAKRASMAREEIPLEELFDESGKMKGVPWDDFLLPVAPSYSAFVDMLKPIDDDDAPREPKE
jgi:hypothetical protein